MSNSGQITTHCKTHSESISVKLPLQRLEFTKQHRQEEKCLKVLP